MTGYLQDLNNGSTTKPVTTVSLARKRANGEKIAMLTCYDSSFASLMNTCGVDILLIGDSLGMVCQGHSSTLPVTIEDIAYHTACVARGNQSSMIIADMPFGTYGNPDIAYLNATKLIQAGAHCVKIEGGAWLKETVKHLTERAIPVCVHLGLTPQFIHMLGGYKVQGKSIESAEQMKKDAIALTGAGASLLLIEAIPASLGREITNLVTIPTIGIGAGPDCSGQVLVLQDMLNIYPGIKARFVKNFMKGRESIQDAITAYVNEVRDSTFPASEHCF